MAGSLLPTTDILIINIILAFWVNPTVSTTEETPKSKLLADNLAAAVLWVQANTIAWEFLTTTIFLDTPNAQITDPHYKYAFVLPDDYLKLLSVDFQDSYRVKNKILFCHVPRVTITYLQFSLDYSSFPSHFYTVVAWHLARLLTASNTAIPNLQAVAEKNYTTMGVQAEATELVLKSPENSTYSPLITNYRYY